MARKPPARCISCGTRCHGERCDPCRRDAVKSSRTVPRRAMFPAYQPQPWMAQGACVNEEPELFFSPADVDKAKAACATCPVAATCLDWARETRQFAGVWGGEDEDSRLAWIRLENRRAARKPVDA